uniref:Uncharacterized protein n=1 Tax=viral metagenome TaxID=1070528 RepID=A0A6M3KN95_9ZZZZ
MPIKGLTDRPPRLPRVGKIHLGVKVKQEGKAEYPRATDYFVFDPAHPQYEELVATYGEQPKELRILLPIEDEAKFAQQYYRLYSMTRGLVCKGDGETALRMVDTKTGDVANRNTKDVAMRPVTCAGRECPDYGPRKCGEVMNLQFLLPEVSGFGVWQIDTGSINSIINVNSALELVRGVYGRVSMVPLILALEPMEVVNPDDGKKKTVRVLNIRSQDKMIEAYHKAQMPPLQLVASMGETGEIGPIEAEQLPPVGDEPIHTDLPVVEESPGTDSNPWPDAPPGQETNADGVIEGILWIDRKAPLPVGKPGMRVGINGTNDVLRWEQADGDGVDGKGGRWVKEMPEAEKPPVVKQAEKEAAEREDKAIGEPWTGMTFADLLEWAKAHRKDKKGTEGWLFKTFGFNIEKAKANPYECALEVKQLTGW